MNYLTRDQWLCTITDLSTPVAHCIFFFYHFWNSHTQYAVYRSMYTCTNTLLGWSKILTAFGRGRVKLLSYIEILTHSDSSWLSFLSLSGLLAVFNLTLVKVLCVISISGNVEAWVAFHVLQEPLFDSTAVWFVLLAGWERRVELCNAGTERRTGFTRPARINWLEGRKKDWSVWGW